MARRNAGHYQDGDQLEDGQGNVGFVRRCVSKRTGASYLRVAIVTGPRAGQWDWPEKFADPVIDWTPDGQLEPCGKCQRWFRTGTDDLGLMRAFCRQCERRDGFEADRIAADPGTCSRFDGVIWKREHRGTRKRI